MNYFLFHHKTYFSDGSKVTGLPEAGQGWTSEKAAVCVVDVDVELASAPQAPAENKDSILARKFQKFHPEDEYLLDDERIDENLFQVIGIKAAKVREIYSILSGSPVSAFVPYAMAVRSFLGAQGLDLKTGGIFIDDLGEEKLLTVFLGAKFSVTRTLSANRPDGLLPEIKRSQIGFSKKIGEFDTWKPEVLQCWTNSRSAANALSSQENIKVSFMDCGFPAFEGLKSLDHGRSHKFLLPEEVKRNKARQEFRKRMVTAGICTAILVPGVCMASVYKVKLMVDQGHLDRLQAQNRRLASQLAGIDLYTYREDLRRRKSLNYAVPYFKVLAILPYSYAMDSFRYVFSGHWKFGCEVFSKEGETLDEIPKIDVLKHAAITDFFVKENPGKRIEVDL